ncbi:rCG60505 [Rattus norvegicus]|uniref:RCG60505 n=1 Tax=Rattus norvegicus TaxID=10116 RepID=A6KKI0_RAT|nr:rCG60505 [Rattus norvegicus]
MHLCLLRFVYKNLRLIHYKQTSIGLTVVCPFCILSNFSPNTIVFNL